MTFYVDDGLTSLPTATEAVNLLKWTQEALKTEGKLRLHKIASNNKEVMEAFPPEDLAKNLENLKLTNQALPVQHSLGIRWNLDSDTFSFDISTDDRPYSRRGVLSTINSIFDHLGFLAPVVVEGRLIQPQLINSTSDWDQPLPTEYFDTWNRWTSSLQELNQLHIRRTYLSDSFSKTEEKSVHIFCDASEKAIAAVSFVRARNNTGQLELGFLHGKSKVAPVHGHTIPRLELCSAVLATEIADTIAHQLQLPLKEFKFYTDSKVVLGYINNESRRFYNYVANRVQKIRSITLTKQWQYVSTNNNPADKGTRGIHASEMANSLWIRGPQFLLKDTTDHTENFTLQNPDVDKELRPEVVNFKTEIEFSQHLGTNRFSRFSLWKNLIKAIARLKHVAHSFAGKSSCKGWHICSDSTSVNAIDEARKLVLREVQLDTYSDEIECLTTRKPLLKSSSIASLTPFLDKENMLRIGGRIQNSDVPDIEKHPILISGRHHIALLIVRHYHELSHHQGRHITEGSIRSAGFWITGGKSLVSSVISKCVKCRIRRASPCTQKMAILPPDRLEPGPPFTNVGVDCFGPWEVLARRTRGGHANSKRWAAMFTCLTTRAVHVEVIEELSSSSFIMALKRFTAIRGPVSHFRSDRGTNFVGSIKELGIQAINVEDGRMKEFLRNQGTTWQFNPPHASHMGGVWERVIGITRRILDSLLMEASRNKLTHEMLVTFLAEASAIVNSRPLVPLTTDPENPMPLSPSLLLTQKPQQINNNQQIIDSKDMYNKQWKCVQILADKFWNRWKNEYLQTLQTQRKWTEPQKNISPGDVVLIRDKQSARNDWPIGIVERTYPGSDQLVRTCDVRIMRNGERAVTYTRPVTEIVYLFLDESWGRSPEKETLMLTMYL